MIAMILSLAVVGALVGALAVVARRRDRRERRALGLDLPARPDPPLVDRPYDDTLCAFCDEAAAYRCRACNRPSCSEHRPWPAHRFCWPCEAEWSRGARRRGWLIAPIVIGVMAAVAGATAGVVVLTHRGSLAAILAPLLVAAPTYAAIDRFLRRRFRPAGALPPAKTR